MNRSRSFRISFAIFAAFLVIFSSSSMVTFQSAAASSSNGKIQHVVIVMMENEQYGSIINNPNGTYETYLSTQYALAGKYYAIFHPSLPNYLALTAGSYFGFGLNDQDPPIGGLPYSNVADLLEARGLSWKDYQEQMPYPCDLADYRASAYTAHHDPFVYYTDIQTNATRCDSDVVSWSQLRYDLNTNNLPNYSFIVPNDKKNSHDTGAAYGDAFLQSFVPTIVNSKEFASTALFIVYDEGVNAAGFGSGQYAAHGGHIVCLLVSPFAKKGYTSINYYDHYNLLATVEAIFNLGNLGRGDAQAVPMSDMFTI